MHAKEQCDDPTKDALSVIPVAPSPEEAVDASQNVTPTSKEPPVREQLRSTLGELLGLAVPNIVAFAMTLVNETTNTVFVGRTGKDVELAAVGIGNTMQNCFGLSLAVGICGALDSLVSQSHGAGDNNQCSVHLQHARLVTAMQLLWIAPLLWCSTTLLVAIGQDPDVAAHAGAYNKASLIGMIAYFQYEAERKFLQNRGSTVIPAVICGIGSLFHVLWCAIFIGYLRLGNQGAGLALSTTWWLQHLLCCAYLWWTAERSGLSRWAVLGLPWTAFKGLMPFLSLAVPATFQVCSEWWFWEVTAVLAGLFGPVQLAAHVSVFTFMWIACTPAFGLSMAGATSVGNALGSGRPKRAKLAAACAVALSVIFWAPIGLLAIVGANTVVAAYTNEIDVQTVAADLLRIYGVVGFFDAPQVVLSAIHRGLAMPHRAAAVNLCCYYLFALPLGCLISFPLGLKVYGIWLSFGIATVVGSTLFVASLCTAKWQALDSGFTSHASVPGQGAADLKHAGDTIE